MMQEQMDSAEMLVPAEIAKVLGRPPLVHGEEPAQYDALFGKFAATIAPADIVEWIYVKDLADAVWDILRLRRWKSATVNSGGRAALACLISERPGAGHKHFIPDAESVEVAEHWWIDGPHKNHVNNILARQGLDGGHGIAAVSAARNLETLAAMDDLLSTAERRYGRTLQEIGAYRAEWRQKLRIAAGAVIEGHAPELAPAAE